MIGKINFTSASLKTSDDGTKELCLKVSDDSRYLADQAIRQIKANPKEYTATLDYKRKKRSLDQNRLMWVLLEMMAQAQNGGRTGGMTAWDCYIDMLAKYGARFEYLECVQEAYPTLKEMFRAIQIVEEREHSGTKTYMCKAYIGSSQFNTREMTMLIDGIFDELADMGVTVETSNEALDYYTQWLEEKEKMMKKGLI